MRGFIIVVAIATLSPSFAAAQVKYETPTQQRQDGRYVIVHSPHARLDTMLLDTATGRTWELVRYTNLQDEPRVWIPVRQENTEADAVATVKAHPPKIDQSSK